MFFAFCGTAIRFYSTVNAFPNCVNVRFTLDDTSTVAQQCDKSRPVAYNAKVFEATALDSAVSHTLVAQAAPLATPNLGSSRRAVLLLTSTDDKDMYFDVDHIEVRSV